MIHFNLNFEIASAPLPNAPTMREIVLDTETTGLDPLDGHRIAEIGAVELVERSPTGKTFHRYLCPERSMPADAVAVHGLPTEFLADKPPFDYVADEFLAFAGDAPLVAHNAGFDIAFLNAKILTTLPLIDLILIRSSTALLAFLGNTSHVGTLRRVLTFHPRAFVRIRFIR